MKSNMIFKGRTLIRFLAILVAVWLFVLQAVGFVAVDAVESPREVVRVGFFAWDGYHIQDEQGVKSGYGYDFLKMAEEYENWKFEHIGYDKSWSDMLDLLEKGEIDVVTSAQKTPEWEKKFDYSQSPIGTSSTVLSIPKDTQKYQVGNPKTYVGMRVGMLRGSSRNQRFEEFAKNKKFSYKAVYYDSLEMLTKALKQGDEIDAALTTNLRSLKEETVLEEFDPVDFYAIVKKGNTKLLDEINDGITKMDLYVPGWRLNLKNKYYASTNNDSINLNKEEQDYLDQLKKENKVFKVVSNPDLAPYSYVENGKVKGIVPEIFEEIAKRIGLKYEYIPIKNYDDYNQFVRERSADIDLTCFSDYGLAEFHSVLLSNTYMSTSLAMITSDQYDGQIKTLAKLNAAERNTTYSNELLNSVKVKEYETHEECIEAVKNGKADATYLYTYAAQKAVEDDPKNRLQYTIMPKYSVDMAIGINEDLDYRLLLVINKGIDSVKESYVPELVEKKLSDLTEQSTIISFVYDYPELSILLLGAFLTIIFLVVLFFIRARGNRKEHMQAQELSRFMGYVCEANEMVLEVNLENMECVMHNMEDGILVSKILPDDFTKYNNYREIIYPEDLELLNQNFNQQEFWTQMGEKGEGTYFEARAKTENGEYRWYSYTICPIPKDKKHPNNFMLFKKDIHEVKQKESEQRQILEDALDAARSASQAKGQFLSRMSHEIRTPLNAVIGYMSIAKDHEDDYGKVMHCVNNSELAAKQLLGIINDVLDISSIENGKMKIAHEDFDLKQQLTAITTIFYNQAKDKNITFEVKLQNMIEEWVVGDSLRVNQILMNLLSNAMKFTQEQGKIVLSVDQYDQDEEKVYMTFAVADTGIGMSKEYLSRIFKPFEQENATTAQKYGGTGLGLSITNNLVEMMDGSIKVESELNKGTTFTVSLSFQKSEKNQLTSRKQCDYSDVRALLVDDDQGSLEYMQAMLKRCKVKSEIVTDGMKAVKQIKRRLGTDYAYNLCIMDWNMPKLDGIETAKLIRKECGEDFPIIIATAYDANQFEKEAKEAGVQKVVSKPLFQSTMFDLLVSTFGKYTPDESETTHKIDLAGLHVLLAEDNEMNTEIALEILKKIGVTADAVTNGEEACTYFNKSKENTYQAILMDIQMPVLNGYEATKEIRNGNHPQATSIPIIAMTANAFAEDVSAALANGMNGHISKPIDYDKLVKILEKCKRSEEYE